jgi:hypothetical protein
MTRVLIIGSSHVGAYKNASDAFSALYPEVEVSFFGVRSPLFMEGRMNGQKRFAVKPRDAKDAKFVTATNGALDVDASAQDHLLMVGHRFAFTDIATLLEEHDVLESVRTGCPRVISETMLRDVIGSLITTTVEQATSAIAPFGKRAVFAMAPYPASTLVERGQGYAMARKLGAFWARPDAVWLFEMWRDALITALEAQGHGLLEQPQMLNDGPFATKPQFATQAAALNGAQLGKTDHRHMNADYGLAMLCTYAEAHLGLPPKLGDEPPMNERIA